MSVTVPLSAKFSFRPTPENTIVKIVDSSGFDRTKLSESGHAIDQAHHAFEISNKPSPWTVTPKRGVAIKGAEVSFSPSVNPAPRKIASRVKEVFAIAVSIDEESGIYL